MWRIHVVPNTIKNSLQIINQGNSILNSQAQNISKQPGGLFLKRQFSSQDSSTYTAVGVATYNIVQFRFHQPDIVQKKLKILSHAYDESSSSTPNLLPSNNPIESKNNINKITQSSTNIESSTLSPDIPILPVSCLTNYENLLNFTKTNQNNQNIYLVRKKALYNFLEYTNSPQLSSPDSEMRLLQDNISHQDSQNDDTYVKNDDNKDVITVDDVDNRAENLTQLESASAPTSTLSLYSAPKQKATHITDQINEETQELMKSKFSSDTPIQFPILSALEKELISLARKNDPNSLQEFLQKQTITISEFGTQKHVLENSNKKDIKEIYDGSVIDESRLNINSQPEHGGSALHQAAAYGHTDNIRILLGFGAILDNNAPNGSTPLHWAAGNGQVEAVKCLLEAGSNPYATTSTWCIDLFGKHSGQTPLHWASESGHIECVQLLHQYAPLTIGLIDEKNTTPLQLAKKEAHGSIINYIQEALEEEYVAVSLELFTKTVVSSTSGMNMT